MSTNVGISTIEFFIVVTFLSDKNFSQLVKSRSRVDRFSNKEAKAFTGDSCLFAGFSGSFIYLK
jgi:hypothetical protein